KHFYCYDIENEIETDLMKDYVVPEETVVLNGYARIAEYQGEIYYTNIREDGVLYKYNPTTKLKVKVTTNTVSNVNFYNGYMYYSTYILGNYALYRTNLTTNETHKISSDRCENLIFSGDYIYYINVGGTYNNYIEKMTIAENMSVDDENNLPVVEQLFKDKSLWVADMQLDGDYIYFTINPMFGTKYLYRYSITQKSGASLGVEALTFTVSGNKIYFYDNDNSLCVCNLDGSSKSVLVTGVEVNDMIVSNGILYYSSTKSGKVGIYSYNLTTSATATISSTNGDAFTVVNGEVYFTRTAVKYVTDKATHVGATSNDGYICKINNGTTVKVA
ncbi:MAG: DUF5050 domain-containing protein, partial [Clostridia bacterium]|nr:DUF5050 domain-containing protein [Clostridia bacterium]